MISYDDLPQSELNGWPTPNDLFVLHKDIKSLPRFSLSYSLTQFLCTDRQSSSPPPLSVLSGHPASVCAQLTAQCWEPQGPKQVSTSLLSQRSWERNTKGSKRPASMVTVLNIPGQCGHSSKSLSSIGELPVCSFCYCNPDSQRGLKLFLSLTLIWVRLIEGVRRAQIEGWV